MGTNRRPRHPKRDEVRRIYLERDGGILHKELAQIAGVSRPMIGSWKKEDEWDRLLEEQRAAQNKRKPGGQPGNSNAQGHGAPPGNTNAEKHGAYSAVHLERLPDSIRANIAALGTDPREHMHREYLLLVAKEEDLIYRISAIDAGGDDAVYLDTQIHMITPRPHKEGEDEDQQPAEEGVEEGMKTSYKMMFQSGAFKRKAALEEQLNRVRGRIAKMLDAMRSYELEVKRFELEAKKYRLRKQELSGQFIIDPKTGQIDDETDEDEEE